MVVVNMFNNRTKLNANQCNLIFSNQQINKLQLNMHMYAHLIVYWLSKSFQQILTRWFAHHELSLDDFNPFSLSFFIETNKRT
jgi:hypothetical protein